jgi:hypothetical protein
MSQDKDEKPRSLGLSPAQVVGSALAAMSVAFFASWAGTAGTMIGAALGSVIATVGAATYTWSLRRTSEAAKRTAALVRQRALLTGTHARLDPGAHLEADLDPDAPVPDPNAPRPGEDAGQPATLTDEAAPQGRLAGWLASSRDLPWLKVALASAAVLVAALGGITAVEAITGKPIASWFGRDDGTGTSVQHVFGSDGGSSKQDQTPRKDTPATPAPSPSPAPTDEPQEPQPSTTPAPQPSTSPEVPVPSTGTSQAPSPGAQP